IYMKDPCSRYVYANEPTLRLFGCSAEELVGSDDTPYFPPETVTQLHEIDARVFRGEQTTEEVDVNYDYGRRVYLEVKTPLYTEGDGRQLWGLLGISTDITERKRAEEERQSLERQLFHAQKLESLGILAGGIAHDFNNILMAVIGNAELALMKGHTEPPVTDYLRQIVQSATRAADLAKQMLAYSGKGMFALERLDMNRLVDDMLPMIESSISKKAELRLDQAPDLPTVNADTGQMRQVILNLVVNASEAIGDCSGVIAVTTRRMTCDRDYLKKNWPDEELREGEYVYLEIADTGCGMDADTASRIFDPFFTTKFTGRGLGLSAVLGIVRGHKGAVKVASKPGEGTAFMIVLPANAAAVERAVEQPIVHDAPDTGTILLVDDEETVREVGREMLVAMGYAAITANDGEEALDIFASRNDIAWVILDLTMPRMNGKECLAELQKIKPDVRVILSSGYAENDIARRFPGKEVAGFIQKPYTLAALKDALDGTKREDQ
ncbi:MAG TPA: response regulator, partial [Geobacteraceae bacterium]